MQYMAAALLILLFIFAFIHYTDDGLDEEE
jgi:hypothetical protein